MNFLTFKSLKVLNMSQEAKNINPESEDLFTTQDLLMEKPITEQEADNMDLISEDLEANPTEDEFMTEVETEAELLGDIAEDDEEVDQPTENDVEAIQADAEQTEASKFHLIPLIPVGIVNKMLFRPRNNRRSQGKTSESESHLRAAAVKSEAYNQVGPRSEAG